MNYEKFLDLVMEDLGSYLPHHHGPMEIQKVDIEKIGAPSYRGLSIGKEGTALRMTMNLEPYYRRVEAGFPYPDIIAGIADKVDQELQKMPAIDVESLSSYNNIRSHLVMELVGTKANRAMLQNVPHKEVEDMSVVYRIKVDIGRDGNATTLVTNRMLNAFGITKEQLHADALESAPAASPATLRRMGDVLGEMLQMEYWIAFPAVIAGLIMVFVASFIEMPVWLRIALIVFALIMIFTVAFIAVGIEQKAGYYECQNCHHRYVPTYWKTNLAMHIGRTRYMKCPECGKRSWQKKVLTKED